VTSGGVGSLCCILSNQQKRLSDRVAITQSFLGKTIVNFAERGQTHGAMRRLEQRGAADIAASKGIAAMIAEEATTCTILTAPFPVVYHLP